MFNRFIRKELDKIAKTKPVRECVNCAFESNVSDRCPKCNSHSFVIYYRENQKVA